MEKKRSSFTGRVGFVLAAAGSAVGLGNLWRFPYLAAKYGGGIFLLVYIILAITFGFTLMVTEIAIGRKTGLSCISAYKKLDKRFGFMGWLSALVPVIITPYYCVIGGWVIRYFAEFVSGHGKDLATSSADFFSNFIGMKGGIVDNPMLWFIIFVALTSAVVIFGVEKGIEKVSKVMMPILVILCVVIAVFALTIDGALAGLKYYLLPDFSKFSSATVLGALGQLFYSMSLAMGIMITYGSYMKKEDNIEKSVRQIEIFDTGIALLAGLIIIPSVVAFNGSKVMMPILVILCVVIAVFALTIDGALAGLKYYLLPDFSKFSSATVLGALGQLFYSMSLAMGIMITYGSYMKKEDNIEKSVRQIEIFDTGIALLAGLIIIPSVVAFNGGSADGINAGPGLMFITLPQVFNAMGSIGGVVGTLFFLLVFFAAITSSISLMETVVSMVRDKFHWNRVVTTVVVTLCTVAIGSLSVLGYGPLANFKIFGMQMLDFFDFISNSVLMPIVAFLTCILIGHVVGTKVIADEVGLSAKFTGEKLHRVMIKWVAPILLVVILVAQVLSAFGIITI